VSGCNEADTVFSVLPDSVLATIPATATTTVFIGNIVPVMSVIATPTTVFVNSLCFSTDVMEQTYVENGIAVVPNPSNGNFNILFDSTVNSGNIEILNAFGETISSQSIINTSFTHIHLGNQASGIYFVKAFDGKKSYCRKLIIGHD